MLPSDLVAVRVISGPFDMDAWVSGGESLSWSSEIMRYMSDSGMKAKTIRPVERREPAKFQKRAAADKNALAARNRAEQHNRARRENAITD